MDVYVLKYTTGIFFTQGVKMKMNLEINLCYDNYFYYMPDQNSMFYDSFKGWKEA